MSPKFSVIMPSRLEPYHNAAEHREEKIYRAVNSVITQSFPDWELIVIADGCEKTKEIIEQYEDRRIVLTECVHKALFDNTPRNTGIKQARGEWIVYLDIDDYWGEDHLEKITEGLGDNKWVWFNDVIYDNGAWIERPCNIKRIGKCGTSNICHRADIGFLWMRPGYAHDFYFIKQFANCKPSAKIGTPEYYVMHIPGSYDL